MYNDLDHGGSSEITAEADFSNVQIRICQQWRRGYQHQAYTQSYVPHHQ